MISYFFCTKGKKPLPLLLLLTPQASHVPSTSWLTGQVASRCLYGLAATPLLFLRSCYSTTRPTHSLRRSFTVIQLEPARYSSPDHKYGLALCLKQGFGEGYRRTFLRNFLGFFFEENIQTTTTARSWPE